MEKKLIDIVIEKMNKEGISARTDISRKWLLTKVANLKPNRIQLMSDRNRLKNTIIIGKMFFYYYDPKTKDSLPYYDRFPLVIPIEMYPDSMLGLNLHYIAPKLRLQLLDKLYEYTSNDKFDEKTKLKLSYNLLSGTTKLFETTPCIKRYLFNHIQSRFLEIESNEWEIAATLPVEKFVKQNKNQIFKLSKGKF